ncbi:MAG: hypothetical protein IPH85_12420 [Ignavibacteria bacterium]|nr:hypothetical protein [Ignavibacteria bacterium]
MMKVSATSGWKGRHRITFDVYGRPTQTQTSPSASTRICAEPIKSGGKKETETSAS